jgi:AraC-like DNA-binding protein
MRVIVPRACGVVLYVLDVTGAVDLRAWQPAVMGVAEVLHASFTDHVYPLHTHDTWSVLIIDQGAVVYDLEHEQHGATHSDVTILPPHVPHDGRSATSSGFRKRVVYLELDQFDEQLIGRAVDSPTLVDVRLRARIAGLHHALRHTGDAFEAESRLALVHERLEQHLHRSIVPPPRARDSGLARQMRQLLDARLETGLSLSEASRLLGTDATHLVRCFSREYGMPPHRYLTGRRLDRARRLLLAGQPVAAVAHEVGFFDQSHLTRHFKRLLGVTPSAYGARRGSPVEPRRLLDGGDPGSVSGGTNRVSRAGATRTRCSSHQTA